MCIIRYSLDTYTYFLSFPFVFFSTSFFSQYYISFSVCIDSGSHIRIYYYYYVYTRRISLRVINSTDHPGGGGGGGGSNTRGMMILGLVGGVSRVCRRRVCCFFFSLLWLGRKGSAVVAAAAAAASARGFLVFPNRSQNNMRKYTIICVCMYKPAKGLIVNFKMFIFFLFLFVIRVHAHTCGVSITPNLSRMASTKRRVPLSVYIICTSIYVNSYPYYNISFYIYNTIRCRRVVSFLCTVHCPLNSFVFFFAPRHA